MKADYFRYMAEVDDPESNSDVIYVSFVFFIFCKIISNNDIFKFLNVIFKSTFFKLMSIEN